MTLTQEQIDALEGVVKRRMENTGETRSQAVDHVCHYFEQVLKVQQAIDDLNN